MDDKQFKVLIDMLNVIIRMIDEMNPKYSTTVDGALCTCDQKGKTSAIVTCPVHG